MTNTFLDPGITFPVLNQPKSGTPAVALRKLGMESLPSAVLLLDQSQKIVFASQLAANILKLDPDSIIGLGIRDLNFEMDRQLPERQNAFENEIPPLRAGTFFRSKIVQLYLFVTFACPVLIHFKYNFRRQAAADPLNNP